MRLKQAGCALILTWNMRAQKLKKSQVRAGTRQLLQGDQVTLLAGLRALNNPINYPAQKPQRRAAPKIKQGGTFSYYHFNG